MKHYARIIALTFASCFATLCAIEKEAEPIILAESEFDDLKVAFREACKEQNPFSAISKALEPYKTANLGSFNISFLTMAILHSLSRTHETTEEEKARLIIAYLITKGAPVNDPPKIQGAFTPLTAAIMMNAPTIVDYLLKKCARVNNPVTNQPLLHFTVMQSNAAVVKVVLERTGKNAAIIDKFGQTPLHHAATQNAIEIADVLLAYGANINAQDNCGNTPLHAAVKGAARKTDTTPMITLLLERGADKSIQDTLGLTPFLICETLPCLQVLLSAGESINTCDDNGRTLLHMLMSSLAPEESFQVIDFLVKQGLSVDVPDKDGQSPLFYAVRNKKVCYVKKLIALGANSLLADNAGNTPLTNLQQFTSLVKLWDQAEKHTQETLQIFKECEIEMQKEIEQRFGQ